MQGLDNLLKNFGFDKDKVLDQIGSNEKKLNGIFQLLGINPSEMIGDAQKMLDDFNAKRAEEHNAIMSKLESMDAAIKKLDKDYVPEEFTLGQLMVVGDWSPDVTNPDTPDGGAVDMSTLDPERIPGRDAAPSAQDELGHHGPKDRDGERLPAKAPAKGKGKADG